MHKNVFTLPVSFTGSYTEEEPNFPLGNNPVSQKVESGVNKGVNFKTFSRPNKEIMYFLRSLTEFNDFSRRLLKVKTFSVFYEPCKSMINISGYESWKS